MTNHQVHQCRAGVNEVEVSLDKMGDDITASFICTGPDRHWLAPPATSAPAGLFVTFHVSPSVGVH